MQVVCQEKCPVTIVKWKVKKGSMISKGSILGLFEISGSDPKSQVKLKSPMSGIVDEIFVAVGKECEPG